MFFNAISPEPCILQYYKNKNTHFIPNIFKKCNVKSCKQPWFQNKNVRSTMPFISDFN